MKDLKYIGKAWLYVNKGYDKAIISNNVKEVEHWIALRGDLSMHEIHDMPLKYNELRAILYPEHYEPRRCSECGQIMSEGYCIGQGADYYCSTDCLLEVMTEHEYEDLYQCDEGYWTEWETTNTKEI